MKKNRLKNLVIKELSLVTRPANQGSYSVLHKSDDMADDIEKVEPKGLFAAVRKYLGRSSEKPSDDEETFEKAFPEASAGLDALGLSVASAFTDDSLTPNDRATAVRKAAQDFCDAVVGTVVVKADDPNSEEPNQDTTMAKSGEGNQDDVLKGLPEPARQLIEKAQADNKALADRLEKMETAQKEKETLTIAKNMVGETTVKPEDVAHVLKQLDEPGRKTVETIFTKANAILKNGVKALTAEIGGDGQPVNAVTKLDAAVAEIQKQDPKVTKQQAVAKALEADPKLYDELR